MVPELKIAPPAPSRPSVPLTAAPLTVTWYPEAA